MRNNLNLAGLISAGLLSVTTAGAIESEQLIEECATLPSNQRIACLENAIRRLSGDTPEVSAEQSADAGAPPSREEPPVAPIPDAAPDVIEAAPQAAAANATAAVETVDETAPEPAQQQADVVLGEEQVARRNNEEEESVRISARIVEHRLVGTGRLRLTLDNGQVWQQTGDDDDRIARRIRDSTNIAVEMWQSRSGGYRMHLVDINRTLRVRRIR